MECLNRDISGVIFEFPNSQKLKISGNQIFEQHDVILEDSKNDPIILFSTFYLSLYKDKLSPLIMKKILSKNFNIKQISMLYDNGVIEVLRFVDGEQRCKEKTKVSCKKNILCIEISNINK